MSVAVAAQRRPSRSSFRSLLTIPEDRIVPFARVPFADAEDLDKETSLLIEQARVSRGIPLLKRCEALDSQARAHARRMARLMVLQHSVTSTTLLQELLGSSIVGENIHRGKNATDMHASIMLSKKSANRVNMVSCHSIVKEEMANSSQAETRFKRI